MEGAVYSLVLLNNTIGTALNAVCLDGTPGAFYILPAADSSRANHWQFYFEGGGWCLSEWDCADRAMGDLGSSAGYPPTRGGKGGLFSSDCLTNPAFCDFNHVYLKYCDGNSFAGLRDAAVPTPDGAPVKEVHFRGFAILQATLQTLVRDYGLANAEAVHLTGCSAGGLAAYLHTDYVGDFFKQNAPNLKVFKSSPMSGFFLEAPNVFDVPVYPDEMKYVFNMTNATAGTNQACVAAMSATGEEWKCNFAEHVYNHISYPIFVLNSAYDEWQKGCILTALPVDTKHHYNCSAIPSWQRCIAKLSDCTREQMYTVDGFEETFVRKMTNQAAYSAPGNGAFVHSCSTHCEAQEDSQFTAFTINGVTMQQAVTAWWEASESEPASSHTYLPCLLNLDASECNPSCGGAQESPLRHRAPANALVPEV